MVGGRVTGSVAVMAKQVLESAVLKQQAHNGRVPALGGQDEGRAAAEGLRGIHKSAALQQEPRNLKVAALTCNSERGRTSAISE